MRPYVPLEVNQTVELVTVSQEGEVSYRSRVEGVDGRRIVVAAPVREGRVIHLPVGTRITLVCLRTDPVRGGRYEADTEVDAHLRGEPPLLSLRPPAAWRKIQLRNFARVDALLPVTYRVLGPDGEVGPVLKGETRDVSGGGIRLGVVQPLSIGTLVELTLGLPAGPVQAVGEVVGGEPESRPLGPPGAGTLPDGAPRGAGNRLPASPEARLHFVTIDERQRDRIVRFVFQRQVEMRRKGLV